MEKYKEFLVLLSAAVAAYFDTTITFLYALLIGFAFNIFAGLRADEVKFMLTMFPLPMIEEYANKNGWIIHRVERTISASKTSRRKQEEWMVCNYEEHPQRTLFDYKDSGDVDTTDAS